MVDIKIDIGKGKKGCRVTREMTDDEEFFGDASKEPGWMGWISLALIIFYFVTRSL